MNKIPLNIAGLDGGVIIKKESKGGKGNWKYYDCLLDKNKGNEHVNYFVDNAKIVNLDTGDVLICPEAFMDSETAVSVAVAMNFDETRKVYIDGKWMSLKEFWETPHWGGFDFSTHVEISEEEFYHIPVDESLTLSSVEEHVKVFDKLWTLVERYGIDFIKENSLSLAPWYKSLSINGLNFSSIQSAGTRIESDYQLFYIYGREGCFRKFVYNDGTIECYVEGLEE